MAKPTRRDFLKQSMYLGGASIVAGPLSKALAAASPKTDLKPNSWDWIAREKIRAGWIYYKDGADKVHKFKKLGMNALITHTAYEGMTSETFGEWARQSRQAGMKLFGVVRYSGLADDFGARRVVFGNGYESPNGSAVLYVLDALSGKLLRKIDTGAGSGNGLSEPQSLTSTMTGEWIMSMAVTSPERSGSLI